MSKAHRDMIRPFFDYSTSGPVGVDFYVVNVIQHYKVVEQALNCSPCGLCDNSLIMKCLIDYMKLRKKSKNNNFGIFKI